MARGETVQNKVFLKGTNDEYIVFVDDVEAYKKWQTDKSVPLAHFVSTFKIFVTHNQGVQGQLESPAKGQLDDEFGTHVDEEVIATILEKGKLQESEFPQRQGVRNESQGTRGGH